MYCWKCGTKLEDNARFCTNCGTRLDEDTSVTNTPEPSAPVMPEAPVMEQPATYGAEQPAMYGAEQPAVVPPVPEAKPANGKKRMWLYVGLTAIVAAIGVALFFFLKKGDENGSLAEEPAKNVVAETDGEVQTFTISPDSNVVKTSDFAIKMPITCLEGDAQLTVQRVAPKVELPMDAGHHVVLSVNMGDKHDLEGLAEIKVPFKKQIANAKVCAGYLNPETKEWEPVDWTYKNGEAVIWTDHLSEYGVFEVAEEMTSRMHFSALLDPFDVMGQAHEDFDEIVGLFDYLIHSDGEEAETLDKAADVYGKFSQFGMDMGYNVIKALGYENAFLEKFGDEMGWLGVFFSTWQIARYAHEGKDTEVAGNTLKTIVNFWGGKALGAIGGAVGYGSLAGIAVFDYVLNEFMTRVVANRLEQYKKAYLAYYKDNKWDERTWYRKLWPIMSDTKLSSEEVHEAVEELVTNRVYEFWEDWDNPDKSHLLDYYTDGATTLDGKSRTATSLGGGLNDKMIEEISEWYRTHLHETAIANAMKEIAGKLRAKNFERYKKVLVEQARLLNKWIEFNITDTDMKNGSTSALKGYKVRFRDLPKRVSDKEKWEAEIDEKGRGLIKIVNYAYMYQNMKPVVQLVSPKGEVVREIEYTVGVPTTQIRVSLNEPVKIPNWVMGTWRNHMGELGHGRDDMYEELVISPSHINLGNTYINSTTNGKPEWNLQIDADYEVLEGGETVVKDRSEYEIKLYNANDPDLEGIEMTVILNTNGNPWVAIDGYSKTGKLKGTLYPVSRYK